MRRTAIFATCAAMVAALAMTVSAQSSKTYKVRLSPVPLDAQLSQVVSGLGSATASLSGNTLTVTGSFDGLKSPATIAQIHQAPRGVRGPVVFDLKVMPTGMGGLISGSVTLTAQQVADLDKAWFYIQLHSEKAPDGNLWGWLMLQETKR
jgi:hypothetical protein